MQCSLCGAENPNSAKRCGLCDSDLKSNDTHQVTETSTDSSHLILDPVDLTRPNIIWSRLAVLIFVLMIVAAPWYLMSDLFQVPTSIETSRDQFSSLRESYLKDPEGWNKQKNQILREMHRHRQDDEPTKGEAVFQDLPLEVLMAYLADDLNFMDKRFRHVCLYPAAETPAARVIISKYEPGFWPFKILVSLEVELETVGKRVVPRFHRLRRGNREVAQGLAWVYFATELQSLRELESFAGGIRLFQLRAQEREEGVADQPDYRLSWHYLHRAI